MSFSAFSAEVEAKAGCDANAGNSQLLATCHSKVEEQFREIEALKNQINALLEKIQQKPKPVKKEEPTPLTRRIHPDLLPIYTLGSVWVGLVAVAGGVGYYFFSYKERQNKLWANAR